MGPLGPGVTGLGGVTAPCPSLPPVATVGSLWGCDERAAILSYCPGVSLYDCPAYTQSLDIQMRTNAQDSHPKFLPCFSWAPFKITTQS